MASIFISYRRSDSAGLAGRLYDRLERNFARGELFIDIDSIEAGADFTQVLDETLAQCRIVLVMIGPGWLASPDGQGGRRLDDPGDFVRREIEAALARDIAVVPVLVDGAVMPMAAQLPESLRKLAVRNAVEIRTARFGPDADDLIRSLKARMKREKPRKAAFAAVAGLVLMLAGGLGLAAYRGLPPFAGLDRERGQRAFAGQEQPAPIEGRLTGAASQDAKADGDDAGVMRTPVIQHVPAPVPAPESLRSAAMAQTPAATPVVVASAAPPETAPASSAPAPVAATASAGPRKTAESFRDCETCPAMVSIPPGRFTIGSPLTERGRSPDEGPPREIAIAGLLAVSRYPVSFDQWDACLAEGGCNAYRPGDYGWGRGKSPVIFVSWQDAKAYVAWLSQKTGQVYRLLSEAEWEYAARGCSSSRCANDPFWFGAEITPGKANYDWRQSYNDSPKAQGLRRTYPIDTDAANDFGLNQMAGNVRQWVEDCWVPDYAEMPGDGAARLGGDCARRVTRGGSWADDPKELRSAARSWEVADPRGRSAQIGFRVARVLAR